ncbi:MAG TPA: glycosyltransferase family 39 protein [Candidatus Omnitrophota bacterium]|nr:glycosyltransferase family 39 protein [Candidatus Omnitrophota bacterium]HPB68970.1 glycosyltransferase family 39 protein [Candidatus Omnitrophota bacterium]HQO58107.1 glycosyltransferase family 39 protein [Candidatus Omnitrophota bacterium]
MSKLFVQKTFIAVFLALLTLSAWNTRLNNFQRTYPDITIDEDLFMHLGFYMTENVSHYNTIPYAAKMRSEGRAVPGYVLKPLFKHPPLYPFLISVAYKIFAGRPPAAIHVSLLFGVLAIPLGYLLGSLVFNRSVGLCSAVFMYLDPIHIICSQKIWMETTLSFFTVLSLYLFIYGLKNGKTFFFIFSGMAAGLAALTKYPGILPALSILIYACFFNKALFRDKNFLIGLLAPAAMLLPWGLWNLCVYGPDFFFGLVQDHGLSTRIPRLSFLFVSVAALLTLSARKDVAGFLNSVKQRLNSKEAQGVSYKYTVLESLGFIGGIIFLYFLAGAVFKNLDLASYPKASWHAGLFKEEGVLFYFKKLTEFSLVYAFAFLSFFIPGDKNKYLPLLKISGLSILLFYSLWRNYQSRYILAGTPFLIILGAYTWTTVFHSFSGQKFPLRMLGRLILLSLAGFILLKTYLINTAVSYGNNMCYF